MIVAIISNDKVVFALAFGITVVVGTLIALWSRPRRLPVVWALISIAAIAGAAIGTVAAFRAASPTTEAAAPVATPPGPVATSLPSPPGTGGTPPPPFPSPACSQNGTKLQITAQGIAFSTDCLAAPPDTAFIITFDNQDAGTPHNIHIFTANPSSDPSAKSLFAGELVTGPATATYEVPAIPAGTYFFHCDVHPTQMFGTFVSG